FLDASGNPTTDPIGAGPFPVRSRLPAFYVDVSGAAGQQVTLAPKGRLYGETIVTAAFDLNLNKVVAKFDNVFIGAGKTGEVLRLQAQFLTIGGTVDASTTFTLTHGQAAKLLFA